MKYYFNSLSAVLVAIENGGKLELRNFDEFESLHSASGLTFWSWLVFQAENGILRAALSEEQLEAMPEAVQGFLKHMAADVK
mgnify:CR=1 FL=1